MDDLIAWLVAFGDGTRIWPGSEDLTIGGVTYRGGGELMSLGAAEARDGSDAARLSGMADATDPTMRTHLMQDSGPVTVEVEWARSQDRGITWSRLDFRFVGQITNPQITDGLYRFEIETHGGDADRGRPRWWSSDAQQERFPGDRGMEYMAELAAGFEATWPPQRD